MENDIIKKVLQALSPDDQKQLLYAHQQLHTRYLVLAHGRYIGVHCQNVRHLTVEHSYNDWSIGMINNHIQRNGVKRDYDLAFS